MQLPQFEIWEFFIAPILLMVGLLLGFTVKDREFRKYYTLGLSARVAGGLFFMIIYLFYYQGGDTIAYYDTAVPLLNLIVSSPADGLTAYFSPYTQENFYLFNKETGYPLIYIYKETNTYTVARVLVPFLFVTFKSYFLTTLLLGMVSMIGPWRLFLTLNRIVPDSKGIIAFSVLLFPSVLFWGSGISKDTITFSAVCYAVHGFYHTLIVREIRPLRVLYTSFSVLLILLIKPYIFLVLFPGGGLWYFYDAIKGIKNPWLRKSIAPLIVFLGALVFITIISQIGDILGEYAFDNIVDKAITTQEDLKRDYYGGNSFDIGTIDRSWFGMLSKFPIATFYGFFGPTLLQVRNVVMFASSLENTYLLVLTILVFVFRNPLQTFNTVFSNPLLIFCFSFSLLFAFALGFSTSNFGALVRFRIPFLPFFNLMLLLLYFRKTTYQK